MTFSVSDFTTSNVAQNKASFILRYAQFTAYQYHIMNLETVVSHLSLIDKTRLYSQTNYLASYKLYRLEIQ